MYDQYSALGEQYADKEYDYYEQPRPEMLDFIPSDARFMLDVGCSSGAFGGLIKRERPGVVVWGIEPNEQVCRVASERLDKVICGPFNEDVPELSGQKFDCIIFNDVLEHLVNPDQALTVAKEYLAENGSVVASIPNVLHFYNIWQILTQQDWKYADSGIMDNTHLRFFTKKSIERMFGECGFSLSKIDGINASYGAKYSILNFLTLGHLKDWKYVQFAVRAQIRIS